MKCSRAVDTMLEADPRELTAEGDSELASHLRSCARCSAVANRLVVGQTSLAQELDTVLPRIRVDEALQCAERKARVVRRRNLLWHIGAPIAAAAGLAGLVLFGNGGDGTNSNVQARVPEPLPGLDVKGPPDRDVAVFKVTDRPDIVVVWMLDVGDA